MDGTYPVGNGFGFHAPPPRRHPSTGPSGRRRRESSGRPNPGHHHRHFHPNPSRSRPAIRSRCPAGGDLPRKGKVGSKAAPFGHPAGRAQQVRPPGQPQSAQGDAGGHRPTRPFLGCSPVRGSADRLPGGTGSAGERRPAGGRTPRRRRSRTVRVRLDAPFHPGPGPYLQTRHHGPIPARPAGPDRSDLPVSRLGHPPRRGTGDRRSLSRALAVRILHTSDWHVGKKLGPFDRSEEQRRAIEEVAAIADDENVDLVIHSGDVFDRPIPPVAALDLALEGLVRLTNGGKRPVVAIAGNHDSPALFETLARFLVGQNIHLIGEVKSPAEGGLQDITTPSGRAVISCFPFLREGRTFNVWQPYEEHYQRYAHRLAAISQAYAREATRRAGRDAVTILVAHFLVGGAKVHGHGAPRGERELHMGEVYAADSQAIPSGPQYVALGHIHAPQPVPGAQVPAEYAGSLLQLDFGEAGEHKRVVIVDVRPGRRAQVRSVPVGGWRPLLRPHGTWEEILDLDGLEDAYLDLTVVTDGPDPGLADRARSRFDRVVKIRADYPRTEAERPSREGRGLVDLYQDFYRADEGMDPPDDLVDRFRQLMDEVGSASS
ncbi:MAG: exonuclease SbcCD subunit D [Acidimicrobiia bacterium]|nr:exonuclease SbcCD subunit D [Acidimicrobiia bacterium]